jgi:DNA-binding MarR family transcriptional regulator
MYHEEYRGGMVSPVTADAPDASDSPEARVAEGRELTLLVHDLADRTRADFTRAVEPLGLSSRMARGLMLLTEPTSMRTLAAWMKCDPSYVTGVADDLERAGLAERVVGADRRVKLLAPTAAGTRVRADVVDVIASQATMLRLTPVERVQLRDLLRRLLAD